MFGSSFSVRRSFTRGLSAACYRVGNWFPQVCSNSGWSEGPFFYHPCGEFSVGGLSLGQRFNAAFYMVGDWWSQDDWVWEVGFRENLSVHANVCAVFFFKGWRR